MEEGSPTGPICCGGGAQNVWWRRKSSGDGKLEPKKKKKSEKREGQKERSERSSEKMKIENEVKRLSPWITQRREEKRRESGFSSWKTEMLIQRH